MEETWKKIEGYDDKYAISSNGNIKNISRNNVMKTYITVHGYELVSLARKGLPYYHASIHRLVAEYFCANPYKYPVVNHIDGNKRNNHFSNLEWCTFSENNKHAIRTGLYKTHFQTNNPNKGMLGKDAKDHKVIEQYTKDGIYVATHYGCNQASRDTGIGAPGISNCCTGKLKSAGGFIWKFKIAA